MDGYWESNPRCNISDYDNSLSLSLTHTHTHTCSHVRMHTHTHIHTHTNTHTSAENAEADAFFCFASLMTEIGDLFTKTLDTAQTGIGGQYCSLGCLSVRFTIKFLEL